MDEAYHIFSYLPLRYKSNDEEEYVGFLWSAFEKNYEAGHYQFAFLSFHMLFMCFVYTTIWKIKSIHPQDFENISLGFQDCIADCSSPFSFAIESESKILSIFKYWGIDKAQIGKYKKLVVKRNDVAHSNGKILYQSQESLDEQIAEIIGFCEQIQEKTTSSILGCYKEFLTNNNSLDDSPFSTVEEMQNDIFVSNHYISQKDLLSCTNFDIASLSEVENFDSIQDIHTQIVELNMEE